jgi:selenocysteine lyase/cysteine desulfurase
MAALGVDVCSRASIALYNDEADIEALLAGLGEVRRILT